MSTAAPIDVVPGMPPVVDPTNLYSETGPNMLAGAVKDDAFRVYVPNEALGDGHRHRPTTYEVIDTYATGAIPQHVVPAWDLEPSTPSTTAGTRSRRSIRRRARTAKTSRSNPYNLYFTPDRQHAIIVRRRSSG
ncbi:MAG: hypothetical protein R2690_18395 [Acidimicrobiales bacterium]